MQLAVFLVQSRPSCPAHLAARCRSMKWQRPTAVRQHGRGASLQQQVDNLRMAQVGRQAQSRNATPIKAGCCTAADVGEQPRHGGGIAHGDGGMQRRKAGYVWGIFHGATWIRRGEGASGGRSVDAAAAAVTAATATAAAGSSRLASCTMAVLARPTSTHQGAPLQPQVPAVAAAELTRTCGFARSLNS